MNNQAAASEKLRPLKKWACHKLECLGDFLRTYASLPANHERYYLELHAGPGHYLCPNTGKPIDGAPLRALTAGFRRGILVTGNDDDTANLQRLITNRDNAMDVLTGNPNNTTFLRQLLDRIPRSAASFTFIDPPGYRALRWQTIDRMVRHSLDWQGRRTDLLLVFPLEMALLRNLSRPDCEKSINSLYGSEKWQAVREEKQAGELDTGKVRQALVDLFRTRLKELGYRYVYDLQPASLGGQPLYHLIWASDTGRGKGLLEEAWGKPRFLPCELMYSKDDSHAE